MNEREFQQFLEKFFQALDNRQMDTCQRLLAHMRSLPLDPRYRAWLDYCEAIFLTEASPPRWDQAERLLIPLLGNPIEPELRARVLLELGINADFQGDCPRAVDRYRRSLSLFEQLGDALYQAKALKNLGIAYTRGYELAQFSQAALNEALACHQRSLTIAEASGEQWLAATVRQALGTVYKALGQWDQALEHYRRKAAICRCLGKRYSLGLALNNMGEVYQRKQMWNRAAFCYQQALTIMREFSSLYEEADVLANFASLHRDQGEWAEAQRLYNQAIAGVESIRAALSVEGARSGFFGTEAHVYEGYLRLCLEMNQPHAAFNALERAKSRGFTELLANRPLRPPQAVPAEWLAQEQHLRQQLDTLYRQDPGAGSRDTHVKHLEKALDELRHTIAVCDAEYASFQTVDPLDLAAVQERLPAHALLLEYFVTADDARVFLVSHAGLKVVPLPISLSTLRRAFAAERQVLAHLTPDRNGRLHRPWPLAELYRLLIEPIVGRLHGQQLLCIIPHGPLHYVPFHALFTGQGDRPRYVLDILDGTDILYAPSATVLLEYCRRKAPSQQIGALIMAYSHNLRHVEVEGQGVATVLGGQLYAGDQATRSVIYQEADRYRFLHLACHGRFNPHFPLASGLTLADGVLDTLDVLQRVRLDAELVVLSGCETGQGALRRGDEIIGLVRAVIYAGTPSVLVSLWPVDDLSTRLLMERFYLELTTQNGVTKAEALRRAQRYLMTLTAASLREWLIERGLDEATVDHELRRLRRATEETSEGTGDQQRLFAHPYYWAPFLLIGDRL